MCDCLCSFEFSVENNNCVGTENVERSTLELIYIMTNNSRDYNLENVISRPVVAEII